MFNHEEEKKTTGDSQCFVAKVLYLNEDNSLYILRVLRDLRG